MKEWYRKLNIPMRTAVLSLVALLIVLVITSFLFFIGYSEIPLGILLGGGVGIISYALLGLVNNKGDKKPIASIVLMIVRFLIVMGVLVLVGYLYYVEQIHLFNIFAVTGGYLLTVVCLFIAIRKEGK